MSKTSSSDYSQPEFYRFNEDSLKLVRWIESQVKEANHILDLGAGAGILGIELANFYAPESLTLLEMQEDYLIHLQENLTTQLTVKTNPLVVMSSFGEWKPLRDYDLIVCNPPYYLPGHGHPSADKRKHLSRTFVKDNWDILLDLIEKSLTPEGKAFMVFKKNDLILKKLKGHSFHINNDHGLCYVELTRLQKD